MVIIFSSHYIIFKDNILIISFDIKIYMEISSFLENLIHRLI